MLRHIKRKHQTILMAEPQNLRFRQFQAFFTLKGKKRKKKKVGPILQVIFDYLSNKKKLKIGPLLDFYGFSEQKRANPKRFFKISKVQYLSRDVSNIKFGQFLQQNWKTLFCPPALKKSKKILTNQHIFSISFRGFFFENRTTTDRWLGGRHSILSLPV